MKYSTLLASALALTVSVGVVRAADLGGQTQVYSTPSSASPIGYWSGLYLGANIGYGFGDARFNDTSTTSYEPTAARFGRAPSGFTGGLQVGYNYQFNNFVLGAEGEIGYLGLSKKSFDTANGGSAATLYSKVNGGAFGAITGRVGYAFGSFLLYNKGGVAFYDGQTELLDATTGLATSKGSTRVGWTIGGGVEYAISRNWSVKFEGDYYDFGSKHVSGTVGGTPYTWRSKLDTNVIRAGINYRF